MAEKDLKTLFVHQLKDTYFAENAILKALPQMAEAAQSGELKGALAVHLKETEGQVQRLEQVFQLVGERPEGVPCKAIQGIIEEGQEVLREFQGGEALDAGLIAAAQAVEHYEITRYGTLLAWAKQLGLSEAEGLIQETLIEEENTDELLSDLAEDAINPAAAAYTGSGRRARLGLLDCCEAGRLIGHESRRQAMARVAGHLSVEDLEAGFRSACDPTAMRHFQVIWLLARGHTIADVAAVTSFGPRWIEQLLARYNAHGPEALGDLRRRNGSAPSVLRPELLARLPERLATPPSDGGLWTGPKVAAWMAGERGRAAVLPQRGWEALKAINWSVQKPRPRHPAAATPEERETFKKSWPRWSRRKQQSTRTNRLRSGPPTNTALG